MSQKARIKEADTALLNFIWNCIENDSATQKIIPSQEHISFCSPKTVNTKGTRKLSIFLYNITEEIATKNIPPTVDQSRNSTDRATFALHYLVTPFTGNDRDDHSLLEKIIHMFLANSLIVSADLENKVGFMVHIDSLSLDELSKLWIALGTPFRLSVSVTVSSAELGRDTQSQVTVTAVAPQTATLDTKNVVQLYQTVLKTFTEQSNGWRNRNMVVKQWVLQDFEKNTNMTVEEMIIMLNDLGNKMEQHVSKAQFIKPLNLLAGYYKHQLDQLKGLQKVSHRQTENIETISAWIKDVEALVQALGS